MHHRGSSTSYIRYVLCYGRMTDAFRALADARRRSMLAALWPWERTVGSLVDQFGVSQPIVSQQLAVLRGAGLVSVRVDGPRRLYRAQPERLTEVREYLEGFWDERLDRLIAAVREDDAT